MKDPNMGDTLLDTLQSYFVGRENQIKSVDLGNIFGLDSKLIQELIHTLRHEGYPICGDHDGYFYASCDADIMVLFGLPKRKGDDNMPTVRTILPQNTNEVPILRVAAYCRVSTDSEDQQHSLGAQTEYYTKS